MSLSDKPLPVEKLFYFDFITFTERGVDVGLVVGNIYDCRIVGELGHQPSYA